MTDVRSQKTDGKRQREEGEGLGGWESGNGKSEVGMRNAVNEPVALSSKQEEKLKVQSSKQEEKLKAQGSKLKASRKKAQSSKHKGKESEDLSAFSFQLSARAQRVPIIAMTGLAMADDEEKSLAAGMIDRVTKPINLKHLYAVLQKWIQGTI